MLSNIPGSSARLIENVATAFEHPLDTLRSIGSIPVGLAEKAGIPVGTPGTGEHDAAQQLDSMWDALKQRYGSPQAFAETLRTDPVGVVADVSAIASGFGGLARGTAATADFASLPRVASGATRAAEFAGATSDLTNPLNLVTKPLGYGIKATGKGLIKSALGLPGKTERYGATPAKAALELTSGLTPEAIKASSAKKLGELNTELEARAMAAQNAGSTPSLTPARNAVDSGISGVQAANGLVDDLTPMRTQLNTPRPGFTGTTEYPTGSRTPITYSTPPPSPIIGAPPPTPTVVPGTPPAPVISNFQKPMDYLGMKRQFGDDFTRFDAAVPLKDSARKLGNRAYHEMSAEFNRAVPGAQPINQQIQSLTPVRDAAQRTSEKAGIIQDTINRATRPTGAMAATLAGGMTGGPAGAAAVLGAQEALSSPSVRIAAARGAYGTGNAFTSPITSRVFNTAGMAGKTEESANINPATGQPWTQDELQNYPPKLARGGIIRRPTVATVGEAGPEAIVPIGAPPPIHIGSPRMAQAPMPSPVRLHPMMKPRGAKERGAIFESIRKSHNGVMPPRVRIH
jgi:hypothetical protein